MRKARAFFFVCAGILCLALAYHLGAVNARAQGGGDPVVAAGTPDYVVTANGDVYYCAGSPNTGAPYAWVNNVFTGTTPAQQQTLGQVKARYLGK